MKVYKISCTNTRYLVDSDREKMRKIVEFDFGAKSLKDKWDVMNFYIGNPKAKDSDFYNYGDALVFNQKAKDILHSIICHLGEYLPIEIEGIEKEYFMFNVLQICNCIDDENSIYKFRKNGQYENVIGLKNVLENDKNSTIYLLHNGITYNLSKATTSLFMVSDHNGHITGPFCTEGVFPSELEFYQLYKDNKLSGLEFEEMFLVGENYSDIIRK
ncbi:MAG: hypothetical protein RLZZ546_1597 [Bacteroidota bacterium]|jgi:hypothetical protein